MAILPGLRTDQRTFEVGDVVRLDRIAYSHLTRGDSALAEMEARQKSSLVGQVTQVDQVTVEVVWEDGRLGVYAYPGVQTALKWTSTEVLILE